METARPGGVKPSAERLCECSRRPQKSQRVTMSPPSVGKGQHWSQAVFDSTPFSYQKRCLRDLGRVLLHPTRHDDLQNSTPIKSDRPSRQLISFLLHQQPSMSPPNHDATSTPKQWTVKKPEFWIRFGEPLERVSTSKPKQAKYPKVDYDSPRRRCWHHQPVVRGYIFDQDDLHVTQLPTLHAE